MADSTLSSLDAIQARADEYEAQRQRFDSIGQFITANASAADVPVLVAALRAVLALHQEDIFRGHLSNGCATCGGDYPCPTIRAVTAHIDTTPKETP